MSDFELKFTLRQHTPLIHFQHDQPGATLRATEVKPAFDRYLIQKLTGQTEPATAVSAMETHPEYRFWLIGKGNKEQPALDYKLSIRATPAIYPIETFNSQNQRYQNFPGFFANLTREGTPEAKHFSFSPGPVQVEFHSMDETLLAAINRHFADFLAQTNFGSRKTKGFGSFTVEGQRAPASAFYLTLHCGAGDPTQEWRKLFQRIDFFHKALRSGMNNGKGGYLKSPLFLYCKDVLGIQWDKRSVKQHFFSSAASQHADRHPNADAVTFSAPKKSAKDHYYLIRDLLGLATDSDWRSPEYNNTKIQKAHARGAIDRMPSPIIYKPFALGNGQYRVNILLHPIPEAVWGETFHITSTRHREKGELALDFPAAGFFSLEAYFAFLCSDAFDIEDLVGAGDRDTDLITDLFNQLKHNYQHQNPA